MNNNNKQEAFSAVKISLQTLMEMHPTQRAVCSSLIEKMALNAIPDTDITKEMRKISSSIIQEKDKDLIAIRLVNSEISKQISQLKLSPHISEKQLNKINSISLESGTSIAESIKSLWGACQAFSEDSLYLRQQSKVVVGLEHQKLKNSSSNIIAGDIGWSSKQIVKSISPLLRHVLIEHPDNEDISRLFKQSQELSKNNIVDFFEAVALLEASLRQITKTQGRRMAAESGYLRTFQCHLKTMHESLNNSITDNFAFESANDKSKKQFADLFRRFKDASENENNADQLKGIIAANLVSVRNCFEQIMQQQDSHIRKQQRQMDALLASIREQEEKNVKLDKEKEVLALSLSEMKDHAIVDQLTCVGNKRAYTETTTALDRLLDGVDRTDRYGIIVADIDNFKKINDTYGHLVGDKMLTSLAIIFKKVIKESKLQDLVEIFRYGGEEFALIYNNLSIQEAVTFAEKIRVKLERTTFTIKEEKINTTVSIGLSNFSPLATQSHHVFEAADKAMYEAKISGKNQVVLNSNGTYKKFKKNTKAA
jgi:diguanylate cyclase (GGDEF)-like protein